MARARRQPPVASSQQPAKRISSLDGKTPAALSSMHPSARQHWKVEQAPARVFGVPRNAVRRPCNSVSDIKKGYIVSCGNNNDSGTAVRVNENENTITVLTYRHGVRDIFVGAIKHFIVPEELCDDKHDQKELDAQKEQAPINANLAGRGGAKSNQDKIDAFAVF